MDTLYFSIGTDVDVPAIVEINNSHFDYDDPDGFLIIHLSEDEVRNMILKHDIRFFLAKNFDGEILGYVEVAYALNRELLNDMTWTEDELKDFALSVLSGNFVYVKQLAVKRGYHRQGIASFIYRHMEEYVGCSVVVFTAIKPKMNKPSMKFHEKNGYTPVARLRRKNFGCFPFYESIFYVKKK